MKNVWIPVAIVLIVVLAACGYGTLNHIFPMAEPVSCPAAETILSMTLSQKNGVSVSVEPGEYDKFLQGIRSAQPTRQMCVNDYPAAKMYYTVQMETAERGYRYYVYAEGLQVYIESPYEGIYKTDPEFLEFLAAYFEY